MVEVSSGDRVPDELTKFDRTGLHIMRQRKIPKGTDNCGTCIALKGVIGQRVSCAIYPRRPVVCLEFLPGESDCLVARRRAGLVEVP